MKAFLSLLLLFTVSCSTMPKQPNKWMEWQVNGCLPTAISFKQALEKPCKWSHVIVYQYNDNHSNGGKPMAHAIVAFMYPVGKNQLWTYDYMGSYRIHAYLDDPKVIAQCAEIQRGRAENLVTSAEFLDK
jgi:hypothetical protein